MTDQVKSPKRGWKSYLLVASLGLNLLLVGLIVGAVIKGPPDRRGGANTQRMTGSIISALPTEKRVEMRALFKSKRRAEGGDRTAYRQSLADVKAAIKAVPFDRAALETAFVARETSLRQMGSAGREAMIDIIAGLSDQERADLVKKMGKRPDRKKKRKKE